MDAMFLILFTLISIIAIVLYIKKAYIKPANNKNKPQKNSFYNNKFSQPVYVTKPSLPELNQFIESITSIWETQNVTNNGPNVRQFETLVAQRLKVPFASAYVNGHCALEAAVRGLKLTGEVITTPFTFPSTIHALTLNNLTPVFCDIEADSFNINPDKIEALITDKTSAILAVHVYGNPCNVNALQQIADRHKLKLIYDAAHAFGVEINGEGIARFGDVCVFSLHATKAFHSIEGGLITYQNPTYDTVFSKLRNFGYADDSDDVELIGANMKMSELHAAVGILNLQDLDMMLQKRRHIFDIYLKNINTIQGFRLATIPATVTSNYAYCAVEIDKHEAGVSRDELCEMLGEYNVFPRKYFYPLCTDLTCYKNERFYKQYFDIAGTVSNNILCLPIYPDMEPQIAQTLCEIISSLATGKAQKTAPKLQQQIDSVKEDNHENPGQVNHSTNNQPSPETADGVPRPGSDSG